MPRRLIALLASLCAAACAPFITELTADGPYVALQVVGSVRTADGSPVAGVTLDVWARLPGTCEGGFAEGRAISDATGGFSRDIGAWNRPRDVCLWIAVAPPAGSGLAADTLTFQPARLEYAPDTVEVVIVMTPLPAP
jgi:hypothetical protein